MLLLALGSLAVVWYFVLVCAIGWLVGAWPCRECARHRAPHR